MITMAIISKPGWHWASWCYFVVYYFYGVMLTLNIILGCVLDYIGNYLKASEATDRGGDLKDKQIRFMASLWKHQENNGGAGKEAEANKKMK